MDTGVNSLNSQSSVVYLQFSAMEISTVISQYHPY